MPIHITQLLRQIGPDTERVVNETRQRFNLTVRRHLKDETRLQLTTTGGDRNDDKEVRAVRVSVTAGIPTELDEQEFDDALALPLALAPLVRVLEESHRSLESLIEGLTHISKHTGIANQFSDAVPTLQKALVTVAALREEASRAPVLQQIFAINSDVMGIYRFEVPSQATWRDDDRINSKIELYWGVIGLVSRLLGVSVEGLTVKVLAHELAHAYTHLGADADGCRWETALFQRAERGLVEGLAQYYTHRVLERLGRQAPGAKEAYEKVLPHQPDVYRSHEGWVDKYSPEEVRHAMLAIRRREVASLADFNKLLSARHQTGQNDG